jgi:hypothetical protein
MFSSDISKRQNKKEKSFFITLRQLSTAKGMAFSTLEKHTFILQMNFGQHREKVLKAFKS